MYSATKFLLKSYLLMKMLYLVILNFGIKGVGRCAFLQGMIFFLNITKKVLYKGVIKSRPLFPPLGILAPFYCQL